MALLQVGRRFAWFLLVGLLAGMYSLNCFSSKAANGLSRCHFMLKNMPLMDATVDQQKISQVMSCYLQMEKYISNQQSSARKHYFNIAEDKPMDLDWLVIENRLKQIADLPSGSLESFRKLFDAGDPFEKSPINQIDIHHFNALHARSKQSINDEEWLRFIDNRITHVYDRVAIMKRLMINLLANYDKSTVYHQMEPIDKIRLLIHVRVILDNPFELPINHKVILADLPKHALIPSISQRMSLKRKEINPNGNWFSGFWLFFSPLEKEIFQLAHDNDLLHRVFFIKKEALRTLISTKPIDNDESIVIVGGGPVGLMRAVYLSLRGETFTLIEKRSQQSIRRDNIVTIGQGGILQMEMMLFLGFVYFDKTTLSLSHLKNHLIEASIGEIEQFLLAIILDLKTPETEILFSTALVSIEKANNQLVLRLMRQGNHFEIFPTILIIADGAKSKSVKQLGLRSKHFAESTLAIVSVFDRLNQKVYPIKQKAIDMIKFGFFLGKLSFQSVINWVSFRQTFAKWGQGIIFRIRDIDYLYYCTKISEQTFLYDLKNRMYLLHWKKRITHESKHKQIDNTLQKLQDSIDAYIQKRSDEVHLFVDYAITILRHKHHRKEYPTLYNASLVETHISQIERSLLKVEETAVLIVGDAATVTDPTSGFGLKTGMESIISETALYQLGHDIDAFSFAMIQHNRSLFSSRMIKAGLEERKLYRPVVKK